PEEVDRLRWRDDVVESRRHDVDQRVDRLDAGRQIGIAEAGQVGRPHGEIPRERHDVARPVSPGAGAPMKEDDRRPGAPQPPDHVAGAAGGHTVGGERVESGDRVGHGGIVYASLTWRSASLWRRIAPWVSVALPVSSSTRRWKQRWSTPGTGRDPVTWRSARSAGAPTSW